LLTEDAAAAFRCARLLESQVDRERRPGLGRALSPCVVIIVNGLVLRQHAPMQDSENNVLARLHATQPGSNVITRPAQSWVVHEEITDLLNLADVPVGLGCAPGAKCIKARREKRNLATS
jgi:hypothetical protein